MMSIAWVTKESRPTRLSLLGAEQQARVASGPIDLQQASQQLAQEVSKLRLEKTKLENTLASQTGSTKVLNDELQDAKIFAGLTDVEGPGILVTLRDSRKPTQSFVLDQIIHDVDVLRTTNELWNAGAEAISVNGHRVTSRTSCRCVGSTILINNTPIASPILVRAIGDPATLSGAMNLPGGVLAELRNIDASMAQVETIKSMVLTAFTGSTAQRFLKVPSAK